RFETIRPGYQVVYDQLAAPRYAHEILNVQLSPDRRTLSLVTRPRVAAVNYAVTLPALAAQASPPVASSGEPATKGRIHSPERGQSEIDLLTDLTGVEARWESADGKESWTGWLPHPDWRVAREFTRGSAEHDHFFALMDKPGAL